MSPIPSADRVPPTTPSLGPLFDPVGRGLDFLGDRWTLVLIRHLLGRARGFQELRYRAGIAPRILSARLVQMQKRGIVEQRREGTRSRYALTALGRSLEPVVREIALWWVRNFIADAGPFRETTPASVVEALPFLLREERARGAHVVYEVRLTGEGGGVWTVAIDDGKCTVREGFADRADARYTADARDWTVLALGLTDDRAALADGRLVKDGEAGSIAWYFHQPYTSKRSEEGELP